MIFKALILYINSFSLDIRTTRYQDVYSLLYSIEIHSITKEQPPKYILLDLESYSDYEKMFDKISHMGLYFWYFWLGFIEVMIYHKKQLYL